tara:strand:- start:91622 stop:96478 length:4857 start_codon:yes stop_codon:yes gene_type:complete
VHTENDRTESDTEQFSDAVDESSEQGLRWLLDMDLSEPEDKLFKVNGDDFNDEGLSDYEAEVAARPLSRGNASSDDLTSMVDEEIVISSDNQSGSIYTSIEDAVSASDSAGHATAIGAMAIDFSRHRKPTNGNSAASVEDGADILGLSDDDDIGEKFLSIKRVKSQIAAGASQVDAEAVPPEPASENHIAANAMDQAAADAVAADSPVASEPTAASHLKNDDGFLDARYNGGFDEETPHVTEPVAAVVEEEEEPTMPADLPGLEELAQSALTLADEPEEIAAEQAEDFSHEFADLTVDFGDDIEAVEENDLTAAASDSGLELLFPGEDGYEQWLEGSGDDEGQVNDDDSVDLLDTSGFSDAPVPGLVTAASGHDVANDEDMTAPDAAQASNLDIEQPGAEAEQVDAQPALEVSNVLEYVSRKQPPREEEAFDQYLLEGQDLEDNIADVEELEVARIDGIVSVDPSSDVTIDYHEDFRELMAVDGETVTAIAAVVPDLVEEIALQARACLETQGLQHQHVDVSVMLGSDPQSVEQCYAEGFEPIATVCPQTPQALLSLTDRDVETVYIRLCVDNTAQHCNDLLVREQTPAEATPEQDETELATSVDSAGDDNVDAADVDAADEEQVEGFLDGDLDIDDFLSVNTDIGSDADLSGIDVDEAFSGLLDEVDEVLPVAEGLEALSGFTTDDEAVCAEEASMDALSDDAMYMDDAAGSMPAEPEVDAVASVDEVFEAVFDEDLLGDGFDAQLSAGESAQEVDIDAAFAGLGTSSADADAICGVDVEEFSEATHTEAADVAAHDHGEIAVAASAVAAGDGSWCIPAGIAFSHTSRSNSGIFADFLDAFIEEGASEVEKLEDAIGRWEKQVHSEEAFAPVGRILHTLKGIAKGVGLQCYGTLIHNFETLLEALPKPAEDAEQDYFRIVNAWLDAAVKGLDFVRDNRADIASEFPEQETAQTDSETADAADDAAQDASQEPAMPEEAPATSALHTLGVAERAAVRQKKQDQKLADEGAKVLAAQQSVRITSEKLDHLLNLTNQAQQLGVRSAQHTSRSKRVSAELQGRLTSVRSHIGKIADRALVNVAARGGKSTSEMDALEMDQYSELQEAANILREGVEDLADLVDFANRQNIQIEALLKQQASVISTIGSSIQGARVVPVSRLMPGLRRIVRTVSADLGKSVAFRVLNEVGALDRDHYARCQVILEHMVRNALDHGIESPEERLSAGKATTGQITMDVRKSGGDYVMTLSDDGRGIDPDAMRESAYEKGLDVDVDALSDDEVIQLIFHKGFSTARQLSEVSGRGVGMDIVLSELQQIGGDIKIQSVVGEGTVFEVRIPSNVSVNGALFVTAGDNAYAIPLNGLVAVEHVPVEEYFSAVERGTSLSVFDMECTPAYLATLCHGESLPDRDAWGESVPVIIAGSEARYMAIAIDSVEEALELVIRSLGTQFASVPGVAGAATTADGEAVVALDLNVLVENVSNGNLSPVAVDNARDKTVLALVVDDSRTQRMVATSQFDTVGVETITAENGMVAIDLLNTTHRMPDVVLLDVEMPVKDGIETLREIRKSQRYGHLPVIMVTSRTGAKHRALAAEAGCNGYMGKPFNFPVLIEQINKLTGSHLELS